MKKSLVAASIVAVLGIAWTASSWHTGKQIEERMAQVVELVNDKTVPQANLQLSYQDYQRGLFSSTVTYVLREVDGDVNDSIQLISTISHGPFPLVQVARLNLLPAVAAVHTELGKTPVVEGWFKLTKEATPLTVQSRVSYGSTVSSIFNLVPAEGTVSEGVTLAFSGATIQADIAKELASLKVTAAMDSFVVDDNNDKVTLQGFKVAIDNTKGKFDINIGDQKIGMQTLSIEKNDDGNKVNILTIKDLDITSKSTEDDKNIHVLSEYGLGTLHLQGHDFGAGKLALNLRNLDGMATKEFFSIYQQHAPQLLQGDTRSMQEVMGNLVLLLKGEPSIEIAPLSWKNSKGESQLNLTLNLTSPSEDMPNPDEIVKQVKASLVMPVPMITEVVTQAVQLLGIAPPESAPKMAESMVQNFITIPQKMNLIMIKDNTISSNILFADNQIELNGQKMTVSEFVSLINQL